MDVKQIYQRIVDVAHSARGRNALTFSVFLLLSAVMWAVMALSEDEQIDVRMPLTLSKVPSEVTIISGKPSAVNVSMRAKGLQRVKLAWTEAPSLQIDFPKLSAGGHLHLDGPELTSMARTALSNPTVQVVSPDSINIRYTNHPGLRLPVKLDCKVSPSPKCVLRGRPKLSVDTVKLYASGKMPDVDDILTEPLRLTDLDKPTERRVKLLAPSGCRVIPDSVTVYIGIEPLIMKERKVVIEPANVPPNIKLITFPAQIDVIYMMPMSVYKNSDPQLRVVADYHTAGPSGKIKLRLRDVPDILQNVHLSADSAEYFIERQ